MVFSPANVPRVDDRRPASSGGRLVRLFLITGVFFIFLIQRSLKLAMGLLHVRSLFFHLSCSWNSKLICSKEHLNLAKASIFPVVCSRSFMLKWRVPARFFFSYALFVILLLNLLLYLFRLCMFQAQSSLTRKMSCDGCWVVNSRRKGL